MRKLPVLAFLIVLGSGFAFPGAVRADHHEEKVLMVVAVSVKPGQLETYRQRVAKGNGVIQRLGVKGTLRMWQATVAGPNTGTVVVGIEYPSLAAYAEGSTKMAADKEWQSILRGLDDIRTIESTALYREITP